VALFGAIVAIGIGPALWLGAQFGNLDVTPNRPPTVVSEQKVDKAPGAGAAAEEPEADQTKPTRYVPLSGTPSARPSSSASADADDPDVPAPNKPSLPAEPVESDDPTTPPAEGTTGPADPESPGNGDEEPAETQLPVPVDPAGGQAAGQIQES
jgi:hypothetical protein